MAADAQQQIGELEEQLESLEQEHADRVAELRAEWAVSAQTMVAAAREETTSELLKQAEPAHAAAQRKAHKDELEKLRGKMTANIRRLEGELGEATGEKRATVEEMRTYQAKMEEVRQLESDLAKGEIEELRESAGAEKEKLLAAEIVWQESALAKIHDAESRRAALETCLQLFLERAGGQVGHGSSEATNGDSCPVDMLAERKALEPHREWLESTPELLALTERMGDFERALQEFVKAGEAAAQVAADREAKLHADTEEKRQLWDKNHAVTTESHETAMAKHKQAHREHASELSRSHAEEREKLQSEIDAHKDSHAEALAGHLGEHDMEKEQLRAEHVVALRALETAHAAEKSELQEARVADVAQHAFAIDDHIQTAAKEAVAARAAEEQLRTEHAAALKAQTEALEEHEAQRAEEMQKRKADHDSELKLVGQSTDTLKAELREKATEERIATKESLAAEREKLREAHELERAKLREAKDEALELHARTQQSTTDMWRQKADALGAEMQEMKLAASAGA